MRRMRWLVAAVLGCTAALCVAGAFASVKSATSKPTGKPWIVYDVNDEDIPGANFSPLTVGATAAANYINNELGGIDKRPIKVVLCNPHLDPAQTAACANKALAAGALTEIGVGINWGTSGLPILAKAKIAMMPVPISGAEFTSPYSVPLNGGAYTNYSVMGQFAGMHGAKTIAHVGNDVAVNHIGTELLQAGLKRHGGNSVTEIFTPFGAPDLTPALVKATSLKPDFIFLSYGQTDALRALKGLQQLGWPPSKVLLTDVGADKRLFLAPGGSTTNGVYAVTPFDSYQHAANKEVRLFQAKMRKYAHQPGDSVYAQLGFADLMTIYRVAQALGSKFSVASFSTYLRNAQKLPIFMGTTLCKKCAPKDNPAIHNPYVRVVQWKDGKLINASAFLKAGS